MARCGDQQSHFRFSSQKTRRVGLNEQRKARPHHISCVADDVLPRSSATTSSKPKLAGYKGGRIKRVRETVVPLEDDEAVAFADWLRAIDIPHTHVGNESGSSTKSAKLRAIKMKRMGQTAGVWDFEIFIPVKNIDGEIDAYQEVRIELKRIKGGTVSAAQKKWGEVYELAGIPCKICKGAAEAIEYVRTISNEINGKE